MPIRDKKEYYEELRANRSFGLEQPEIDRGMGLGGLLKGPALEESFYGKTIGYVAEDLIFWGQQPTDSTYDPYDDIIGDDLGGYADDLLNSRSYEEYQFRKDRIQRSLDNKAILNDSGVAGLGAQMAWGLVDPVNFVPVFGAASRVYSTTGSLGKAALASAVAGGVSQAGQEAVVSQIDPTYDPQVGAVNIGANTILSGILGPGMLAATRPEVRAAFVEGFNHKLQTDALEDAGVVIKAPEGSAGAMRNVRGMTLDEAEISNTLGVHKSMSWMNRLNRLQSSPSERVRNINMLLNESALMTKGNLSGVASPIPVETEIKLYQPLLATIRKNAAGIYMQYRQSVTGKAGIGVANDLRDVTGRTTKAGALTQTEFAERVAKAMRRGDRDIEGNKFVEQAAGEYRKFFDTVKDEAKRVGIWEDDPDISETAESYFSRVYEQNRIRHEPDILTEGIYQYYKAERDKAIKLIPQRETEITSLRLAIRDMENKVAKAADDAEKTVDDALAKTKKLLDDKIDELEALKWRAAMEDHDLKTTATTTVNRVQKSPTGVVQYDAMYDRAPESRASRAGFRSSMKSRALKIPDTFTWEMNGKTHAFEDFLVNDPDRIMHSQMRSVLPDIQLYERFGRLDLENIKSDVYGEYDILINKAKTEKQRANLAKQREKDLKDIQNSFDILRGTYGQPDDFYSPLPTALRMSKQLNYLRLMGEMTVASFADVGSIVLSEGTMRTFGTAIKSFTTGLRGGALKAPKDELRSLITASESVLNSRFMQMNDFDTYAPVGNKIEAAGNYASNVFQKISLMGYWLDGLRDMTGLMVQDRIIAAALSSNLDTLTKGRLASSFLDAGSIKVIREQFKLHGEVIDGLNVPNLKNWDIDDPKVYAAFQKFRAAVIKDIDTTIVKPGSDKSTWVSDWQLSNIGQFKSFAMSATHRILMKGGQRLALGDMQVLSGITAMIGFGMLSYWAKAQLSGKETSDDPRVWVSEGIDRSGVLGILGDFNNMTEKSFGVGVRPALNVPLATRYVNRNHLETALGPTAGLFQDVAELGRPAFEGNMSQADVKKMRRMMPFQNALGVRYLYDGLEHGLVETFDVPQQRR